MQSLSVYQAAYDQYMAAKAFLAKSLVEEPGTTINSVGIAKGEDGVQALFDVFMDSGERALLVHALNSPALKDWIKERLATFLYGKSGRSVPTLLSVSHCQ